MTVWNWESNATSPQIHVLPQVITFLGYDPFSAPESLAETLLMSRKAAGITQKEMAKRLGIDPTTLARLERGESRKVFAKTQKKLEAISTLSMVRRGTRNSLAGAHLWDRWGHYEPADNSVV